MRLRSLDSFRTIASKASAWAVLLTITLAAPAQQVDILDLELRDGRVQVTFTPAPDSYHLLYRGEDAAHIDRPVAIADTASNPGLLTDPGEVGSARFYQVRQVPNVRPLDIDGDGLDDLYEWTHVPFLDPFNAADALEDPDRDGRTTLREYQEHTDPFLADVRVPVTPTFLPPPDATTASFLTLGGTASTNGWVRVEGGATVVTNDVTANGAFEITVPLGPNRLNRLFVSIVERDGNTSPPRPFDVLQDSQPPTLYADFPTNHALTTAATTVVAGRVGDMLSGFKGLNVWVHSSPTEGNAPQATTVLAPNSPQRATVDVGIGPNGTFERGQVPLREGTNFLSVVATDQLGNRAVRRLEVIRLPLTGDHLATVSGDRQMTNVQRRLAEPIVVRALKGDGSPLAGKRLLFEVTRNNGRLLPFNTNQLATDWTRLPNAGTNGAMALELTTDAAGEARAWWTVGNDAGCGNNRVCVTGDALAASVFFCASAMGNPARQVNIGSGNNQKGEAGAWGSEPLKVWVSDGLNPVAGVPVTFRVVEGGALVSPSIDPTATPGAGATPSTELTVLTRSTGHAEVRFLFGPDSGVNTIEATFADNRFLPATFTAYGLRRDPTHPGSFTGLVLDNTSCPIGGAYCELRVANAKLSAFSDRQGRFRFENVPGGTGQLFVNGAVATSLFTNTIPTNSFPTLTYAVLTVPNAENSLATPVLLPRLNPKNAQVYRGTNDLVLTCEGIEGLKMTIKANSMVLADGRRITPDNPTVVSLNQVHHDNVPMPMPDGASPPFAWTLQPAGAHFDPPIEIEYPNMSGLAPGSIAYFLSFNHDTERFEIVASGHVNNEGSTIQSDPNAGLTISGWGCNCPPYSVTGNCCRPVLLHATDAGLPCNRVPSTKDFRCSIIPRPQSGIEARWLLNIPTDESGLARLIATHSPIHDCEEATVLWEIRHGDTVLANGRFGPDANAGIAFRSPLNGADVDLYSLVVGVDSKDGPEANQRLDESEISDRRCQIRVVDRLESLTSTAALEDIRLAAGAPLNPLVETMVSLFLGKAPKPDFAPNLSSTATVSGIIGQPTLNRGVDHFTHRSCFGLIPKHFWNAGSEVSKIIAESLALEGLPRDILSRAGSCRELLQPTQAAILLVPLKNQAENLTASYSNLTPGAEASFAFELPSVQGPFGTGVLWTKPFLFLDIPSLFWNDLYYGIGAAMFANASATVQIKRTETGLLITKVNVTGTLNDVYDFDSSLLHGLDGTPLAVRTQIAHDPASGNMAGGVFAVEIQIDHTWSAEGTPWPESYQFFGDLFVPPRSRLRGTTEILPDQGPVFDEIPGTDLNWVSAVPAHLHNNWNLSANGQSVILDESAALSIRNILAPDSFGEAGPGSAPDFLGDDYTRITGYNLAGESPLYVFSEFFRIRQGEAIFIKKLTFTDTPPRKAESLTILSPTRVLTTLGTTNQLKVVATYADGTTNDVTARTAWTSYRVSNPALAQVSADGAMVPLARGRVLLTATSEGASAVLGLDISPNDALTTIAGQVLDSNGLPVSGATVRLYDLSVEPVETDSGGRFRIDSIPTGLGELLVEASDIRNVGAKFAYWSAAQGRPENIALVLRELQAPPTRLSAGGGHSMAIRADGSLWAWGRGGEGQLGNGTTEWTWTPFRVAENRTWESVNCGLLSTLAIASDGTLWGWGWNRERQLGFQSGDVVFDPAQVATNQSWRAVSSGVDHTLAIAGDGTLWAWGANAFGQLGDGTTVARSFPIPVDLTNSWLMASAGERFSVAIRTDGTMWSWGYNERGQLGNGGQFGRISSPQQIGRERTWIHVSAGRRHCLAISLAAELWTWGDNLYGQLGDSRGSGGILENSPRSRPGRVPLPKPCANVSAGFEHSAALDNSGTLWTWGQNRAAGFPSPSLTSGKFSPSRPDVDDPKVWRRLATGMGNSIGLAEDGRIYAWGSSGLGSLGNGSTPYQVGASSNWTSVVASGSNFALTKDGDWYGWGPNGDGQFGDGSREDRPRPTLLPALRKWVAFNPCGAWTLALATDQTLWMAGYNSQAQLGDDKPRDRTVFSQIASDRLWSGIGAAGSHGIAIDSEGQLWSWGGNDFGQLGDGSNTQRKLPVLVKGGQYWTAVHMTQRRCFAVDNTGALWGWGSNDYGAVGDGTSQDRWEPSRIDNAHRWVSVDSGTFHSLGLTADGRLWVWGRNNRGQLGNGTGSNSTRPLPIAMNELWSAIAAGEDSSFAIRSDGTLWAWGWNGSSVLGNGITSFGRVPTLVGGDRKWRSVSTTGLYTVAVAADGTLWAWGDNSDGYLGIGPFFEVPGGPVWDASE